jgi:hypothetical protein
LKNCIFYPFVLLVFCYTLYWNDRVSFYITFGRTAADTVVELNRASQTKPLMNIPSSLDYIVGT